MTSNFAIGYLMGFVGTFVWHQYIWNPPAYNKDWDDVFSGSGGMPPWELKENPKDRICTDAIRSVFWPVYVPKMVVGSVLTLESFSDKMDDRIKKKLS